MAYRNFDGKITIDEDAANRDIARINQIIPRLLDAKTVLETMKAQSENTKGDTGSALMEKTTEMIGKINQQISNLEETRLLIQKTVKHYKLLDQKVKAHIMAMKIVK